MSTYTEKAERIISALANITVVSGIIFAYVQITQANQSERVRIAIDAISMTRTSEFLHSYAILKNTNLSNPDEINQAVIDDLNYVMNIYDNVAILYINDLADHCIIKEATCSAVNEFSKILDTTSYPKEYRINLNKFTKRMNNLTCP